MPRGGRRPGAGAPRGNTNALKTGKHSRRVQTVMRILMDEPETRAIIERISAHSRKHALAFITEVARTSAASARDRGRSPESPEETALTRAVLRSRRVTNNPPETPGGPASRVTGEPSSPSLPGKAPGVRSPVEVRIARRIRDARIYLDQEAYIDWMEQQTFIPIARDPRLAHTVGASTPFSPDYDPDDRNNQAWKRELASASTKRQKRNFFRAPKQ
jgi:hypothetical protein